MPNFFYTLLIFPIEQIIELCYIFTFRVFRDPGISIIGLSMIVSTLILPLYIISEKKQQEEREKQSKMKKDVDNIKAVFRGDKRYMMLSTLYRQNNYHPIYAMRSSFSLLIQIPFFIAAFHFLTNLEMLKDQKFYFFADLGSPDGFFRGINILPVLMTAINIVSGYIYTKGLERKDKIQVYGIAVIFLVLLYNSPSGLVLYWTCNNIYNLVKNVLVRTRNAENWIKGLVLFTAFNLVLFLFMVHDGALIKRLFVVSFIVLGVLFFYTWKQLLLFLQIKIDIKNTSLEFPFRTFILSAIGLFLLIGLVIPSSLIASDVSEFSFLGPIPLLSPTPLTYQWMILLQSSGILIWIICLYFLFGKKVRILLTIILTVSLGLSISNTFLSVMDYGHMTSDLHFEIFKNVSYNKIFFNFIIIQILTIAIIALIVRRRKNVLLSLQLIFFTAFLYFGISNSFKINADFKELVNERFPSGFDPSSSGFEKIFTFSRTGNNVLLIVLDSFVSGFIPPIFEEKPDLLNSFRGFTNFPNTVTLGYPTRRGMPGVFGGYYYAPYQTQKRINESINTKSTRANQVLPINFANSGYKVSVFDQSFLGNSNNYRYYENIISGKIHGRYIKEFINKYDDVLIMDYLEILYSNLIRFSFFKTSPIALHSIFYDDGNYLSSAKSFSSVNEYSYRYHTFASYSTLYFLPQITQITDEKNNYATMLVNVLPHEYVFFEAPDYKLSKKINNKGESPFAENPKYHTTMASVLLVSKYLDFLKENNAYDNTRIILVADHGHNNWVDGKPFLNPNFIELPAWHSLPPLNPLLMFKDFNDNFEMKTDNSFMTNADVPHLLSAGIVQKLIDPFNGKELISDKENGAFIPFVLAHEEMMKMINEDRNITDKGYLHVHTNIFEPSNWSIVENDYFFPKEEK